MKIHKFLAITINIFLVSPFISIPFLLVQLRKGRDKCIIAITSLLLGFLSINYIPFFSNDKTRYIERNKIFANYTFPDLIIYFKSVARPDYIFDVTNYLFAQFTTDVRYFFFTVTTLSIYLTLTAIKFIIRFSSDREFILSNTTFLLVLSSLSLVNIFSGMRFFLAGSFFLWFLYNFYFAKKYKISIFFLLLALLTHFSYSLLLVATIFAFFIRLTTIKIKIILCISLVFIVLPSTVILEISNILSLPLQYMNKVDSYVNRDVEVSGNFIILNYLRNLWFYCAFIFLFFSKPSKQDRLFKITTIILIFTNFLIPIPVIFERYLTFFKIIFSIYLVYLKTDKNISNTLFYVFLALYILGLSVDILVLRTNFSASYSFDNMWSIFHIFQRNETLPDYIYP